MPRLRSVGKQAANPLDIAQMRDVTAVASTAAATYVPLTSGNQPQGYGRLDNNSRLLNAQLPTDPSVTTLTSSGKTKAGSLEVTGATTLTGNTVASTATFNGDVKGTKVSNGSWTTDTLAYGFEMIRNGLVVGHISNNSGMRVMAASGTLQLRGTGNNGITVYSTGNATADANLTVIGDTSLSTVTATGAATLAGVTATDVTASGGVTATGEVKGGTVHSGGSLIVDGASSLQALTVAGQLNAAGITASGVIRGDGGIRLGVDQTLSQVDASNNNVPVRITGGIDVSNGALTNVSSLSGPAVLTINSALTATGKGTFSDLESSSNLKINGTLTGVSDLTLSGNLNVTGVGKKITATALQTGTLNATGASTLAGLSASSLTVSGTSTLNGAVTIPDATATNHPVSYGQYFPYTNVRIPSANPSVSYNNWTLLGLDVWEINDGGISTNNTTFTVQSGYEGVYRVGLSLKFANKASQGSKIGCVTLNSTLASNAVPDASYAVAIAWQDTISNDGFVSCSSVVRLSAGDVLRAYAFQYTGSGSILIMKGNCRFEMTRLHK